MGGKRFIFGHYPNQEWNTNFQYFFLKTAYDLWPQVHVLASCQDQGVLTKRYPKELYEPGQTWQLFYRSWASRCPPTVYKIMSPGNFDNFEGREKMWEICNVPPNCLLAIALFSPFLPRFHWSYPAFNSQMKQESIFCNIFFSSPECLL